MTLINRHYDRPATVRIAGAAIEGQASGQLLAASSPQAINSAGQPDQVAPVALPEPEPLAA